MKLAAIMSHSANLLYEPKTVAVASILGRWGWTLHREVEPHWTGFCAKLRWAHKCARELTQYTHLMLMDARDVVVLGPPEQILERFLEFNHPFVCNAEPHIWPQTMYKPEDYPPCDSVYRYVNSGCYLAEREYMLECFEKWTTTAPRRFPMQGEDGPWLTENYLMFPGDILLDHDCKLFQCMCGSDWLVDVEPGQMYNRSTDTYPLVIHYNGGTDITMPERAILWRDNDKVHEIYESASYCA